jgi:hypothetical protein
VRLPPRSSEYSMIPYYSSSGAVEFCCPKERNPWNEWISGVARSAPGAYIPADNLLAQKTLEVQAQKNLLDHSYKTLTCNCAIDEENFQARDNIQVAVWMMGGIHRIPCIKKFSGTLRSSLKSMSLSIL